MAYLSFHSTWMTAMMILNIAICDLTSLVIGDRISIMWRKIIVKYSMPIPVTVTLTLLLSAWTGIPVIHSIILPQ